jgi:hypothetical protein
VAVINRCADGFVGGDESVGFVSSHCVAQVIALHSALRSKEVSSRKRRIEDIVPLFLRLCRNQLIPGDGNRVLSSSCQAVKSPVSHLVAKSEQLRHQAKRQRRLLRHTLSLLVMQVNPFS